MHILRLMPESVSRGVIKNHKKEMKLLELASWKRVMVLVYRKEVMLPNGLRCT